MSSSSPSLSDMHVFRRPAAHDDDASPRSPTFSVHDFETLVSNAFDLPPTPTLALTPASPTPSGPHSAMSPSGRTTAKSYFEDQTEDDHSRLRSIRRSSHRPRSQSFSAFNFQRLLPSSSSTMQAESSTRPGVAKRVLKSLRTRASALVLRPANTPNSSGNGRDTPASLLTLSSRTSTATARPPSSYSALSTSSRYAFPSAADENTPPNTLRRPPSSSLEVDVKVSVKRHRSSSLPLDFLKIPQHPTRDSPRSAHTPLPWAPRSKSPAPTLIGDLVSAQRSTTPSFSCRPRSPSQPSSPPAHLRVHTRLPPLNKSRSFNLLSKNDRKHARKNSIADSLLSPRVTGSSMSIEFDEGELPSRCPSPYTNPRSPPPVPPTSPRTPSNDLWREEDAERELVAPQYVYERRGSAASIHSKASAKSTATFAERITQAIPRSLRLSKLRSRSKLNLSVITNSSNESTPSSFDTSTTFSSSAYSGSLPPTPHTPSFYGMSSSRRTSIESDAMAVDRVLTPENDPFAKGDIEVPLERGKTPVPLDGSPSSPTISKKAWVERKARHRSARKRSTGSGHAHTNSGDTITPLTSGLEQRPGSPMDVDPEYFAAHQSFAFPPAPYHQQPFPSTSSSPLLTPYHEWSPISLRSTAPLPPLGDHIAHIVPLPSSPTPSRSSFGSPIPPSPGPPPNIPLPPSPSAHRTELVPPSPRLRKRKSHASLRAATALANAEAVQAAAVERPPSPFPMSTSVPSESKPYFVNELDAHDNMSTDDLPSRGNGGWVRGPRFALSNFGVGERRTSKPSWPEPPQGFGPPRDVVDSDWDRTVRGVKQLSGYRQEFATPDFGGVENSASEAVLLPSPLRSKPTVRASQSDSALRARSQADARNRRPSLKHARATSHHVRSRRDSTGTLTEIEERWEGDTSRSTAFYSARSSMLSSISSSLGPSQEA